MGFPRMKSKRYLDQSPDAKQDEKTTNAPTMPLEESAKANPNLTIGSIVSNIHVNVAARSVQKTTTYALIACPKN